MKYNGRLDGMGQDLSRLNGWYCGDRRQFVPYIRVRNTQIGYSQVRCVRVGYRALVSSRRKAETKESGKGRKIGAEGR